MSDWKTCSVSASFVKNKVGRRNQIPAKDIAEVGRFPVVDQGQEFVAGYCDEESRVIDFDLPLIIQTTTELKKALIHKLFTESLPRRICG